MTNKTNTVIYTGMTNNLLRRVYEHKHKLSGSFAARYKITKLVYFESFENPSDAIKREKQIKAGSRKKKENLIRHVNSNWGDLFEKFK